MYKKWFSFLVSAAMAFLVSFGGAACLATGFSMNSGGFPGLDIMVSANLGTVALLCALVSLAAGGYFCLPKRWRYLPLVLLLVLAGYLWHREIVSDAVEAVLYRITGVYNLGYHWGVIGWTGKDPGTVSPDLGLCLLTAIPGVLTAGTVRYGKNKLAAVLIGSLPLVACLVVTDTVPDSWCLMAILTGLLLLVFTAGTGKRDAVSANRLTVLLLIPILLFQCFLFWAIPRAHYEVRMNQFQQRILSWFQTLPFVQMGADGNLGIQVGDSVSNAVDLSAIGPRGVLTYPVMTVTASKGGTLYLRGQSMEAYNGISWQSVDNGGKDGWPTGLLKDVGTVTVNTRGGQELFYFPYYPGGQLWTENPGLTQGRLYNSNREKTYTFQQLEPNYYSQVVLSESLREQCLQLPASSLQGAQRHLEALPVNLLTASAETVAEAVAAYVKSTADYNLNTPKMPTGTSDFAMWFLESSDTGYCVHFASAATVLMRAAGIPARYVSGYVLTASAGNAVTVTAEQAHAWVEYFDPMWGWRILEATPGEEVSVTEPTVPETTQQEQTVPATQPGPRPTEESTYPKDTTPNAPAEKLGEKVNLEAFWRVLKIIGGILLGLGLVAGQYLLRLRLRHNRMTAGDSNRQVLERWREVMRMCKILRWTPPKHLLELAEKAKFSQHILTAEERRQFSVFLEKARIALAEKPFVLRWAIRLIWAVA